MALKLCSDMERQTHLLPLLVSLLLVCSASARRGFLLTGPKQLSSGSVEKLCFSFHELAEDVLVTVSLMEENRTLHIQDFVFEEGSDGCVGFEVPSGLDQTRLSLIAEGSSGNYTFYEKAVIGIRVVKTLTFIQTDKPLYKPGQIVQFRVLTLHQDFKPKDVQVSQVVVQDPSGSRIMQWTAMETRHGFLSLDLPLSEEPILGTWKIKAIILDSEQEQTFKVDEYVLPKFEVTVNLPSYVLVNTELIDVEVCARYTYGKPVKGDLRVFAIRKQRYYGQRETPGVTHNYSINGCRKLQINSSSLMLDSVRFSMWEAKLHVSAVVKEEATGISMTGNSTGTTIERVPLKIDLQTASPDYHKPGLPFYGKGIVTKPDGTPAQGELIMLTMNNYRASKNYNFNFTTDENGEFLYTLPQAEKSVVSFTIHARAPKYNFPHVRGRHRITQPITYHSVKQWFSPSGSFVQIDPVEQMVDCDTTLSVNVSYTTMDGSTRTFFYQLMSRGDIMLSGKTERHFNSNVTSSRRKRRSSVPMPSPFSDDIGKEPDMPVLDYVATFVLDIDISTNMSPSSKLIVYYLHDNGEVVADNIIIKINKCFRNKVSLDFGAEQLYPGEAVSVDVKADPESVCGVGVVDKSVQLLGGNNKLNIEKVFASIKDLDFDENSPPFFHDDYCDKKIKGSNPDFDLPGMPGPPGGPEPVPVPMFNRRRRMIWPGYRGYSRYFDSSHAFKLFGAVTVSDLVLDSRPCEREVYTMKIYQASVEFDHDDGARASRGPAGMPGRAKKGSKFRNSPPENRTPDRKSEKKVVDLRNYFPETWIWKFIDIGSSGQNVMSEQMPHSITEWIGTAMCTNPESGLGISSPASVKGFQPFFASFTLPYSVIRGEKVPVLVNVFNYLPDCLVVELTLKKGTSFRVASDSRTARICVCGTESASNTFHIVPTEMGKINITVTAVSVPSNEVCGNGASLSSETGARDAVTRSLIVEAEGREEEYTKSSFICPDGRSYTEMFDLTVPEKVIEDSARAYITAIGDVMGPALSGLDKLLKLPTGCGEQNMLKFAPNIYVLQYLTETNQDAPKITKKAIEFMRTGYQRELTYRHNDGSYSAFGERDGEGSMWLTAFVVKSFAQARSFIYIDEDDLKKSISWFKTQQLENGCFPQVGKVLHKAMKGGLANGANPTASLTAYVLAAMLSAGIEKEDRAVQDALLCLRSQTVTDSYTLAQMAYAYTLYNPNLGERAEVLSRLEGTAIRGNGMAHWEAPKKASTSDNALFYNMPSSADVELTSYILLTHVMSGDAGAVQTGQPIVRWISTQRNAYGGFASTQDTVVALQALSRFASLTYGEDSGVRIRVEGQDIEHEFDIKEENKLMLFSQKINVPNQLLVQATGEGCAFFQANVKYNMPLEEKSSRPAFHVRVSVPNRGIGRGSDACKKRKITVCTRYLESDSASNMAIVAVKMVSGWIPIKESVNKINSDTLHGLKRIEMDHKWVNFYFDELTADVTCLSFEVIQDMEIEHAKPAFVHVYDYYEPELAVKQKYKIRRVCGTKLELPVLTKKEYDRIKHTEQARMPVELPVITINPGGSAPGPPRAEEVCPVCLMEVPEDFVNRFCHSRHVYKTEVRQKGRFPLKVLTDLRSGKENIQRYTKIIMHSTCGPCETLSRKGGANKILILTKETRVVGTSKNQGSINLQSDVTLIPMTEVRQMHRRIRKIVKNKTCEK